MELLPEDGLARCAGVFLPGRPSREGRLAFWRPDGGPLPELARHAAEPSGPDRAAHEAASGSGASSPLTIARRHGRSARVRTVPSVTFPVSAVLPLLLRARHVRGAHPATACWGAAAQHALQLLARGRILPGLSEGDVDEWRTGPFDAGDTAHLRAIAAAMHAEAHAVPVPGSRPLRLPDPLSLLRAFLDAVADTLPRTPAAPHAAGGPFAARAPQRLPHAREWAAEVAAGMDAGVRISLRLDLAAHDVFDAGPDGSPGAGGSAGRGVAAGGDEGEVPLPVGQERRSAAVVQVHSLAEPTLVADAAELWSGAGDFGPRSRMDALLAVRRAARVWPPLGRLLERPVPDVLPLSEEEVADLLGRAATRLAAAGVAVHWPRDLARELTATAVIRPAPGSAADGFGFFEADELLDFRWQLALGGEQLTESEMDALAEAHRPVVRLRGQWVLVDPALIRKARKRQLGLLAPLDALSAALSGTVEVDGETVEAVPAGALAALRDRLTARLPLPSPPEGLHADLREYQLRGLAWLETMTSLGLGGCLADDMGLGKTVTLIALHLRRAHPAPTLVVCPASLLGNWQREIERFAPGVEVRRFHGSDRSLEDTGEAGGFVLTTYGTMRASAAELAERRWGLLVADEAQHVKNPRSATAAALRTLRAPARVALTGTPAENNLSELWAVLDWTTPGLLGPLTAFRSRHARAVEGGEDQEATERLARLVRPFLLRRRKSDPGIVPELPPKTETDHPVALAREQAGLYAAVVREALTQIEAAEGIARRGLVMKLLTALKQICNHPAQYLREAAGPPGGEEQAVWKNRSGKLELLDELLDTILAEGGAVLVFTQYVAMARIIERHLRRRGVPVQLLHGGTPVPRREEMVRRFQEGLCPVFLLSLKAAGTGLNLTRASHVVHYDRWWNPAVEDQATDRAYRIGQTQPVQVHRLVTEGTVEERIALLLESKKELADAVLGGGEGALSELSDAELADLVRLRRTA
ncbi:DEAD/DEAH box helicase [Streptomyces sp. WMMB 714]|uniref:DEAD/DEAH box helicase n=1 Tax=Streptomyces sp. WMMB 714 TaxID=1286822 RepID=UPI0005F802FB|nr:DEAD/DEAH box helicase [Streptomyces sp. WMMB 714]